MTILFLHGLHSTPGGLKRTCLKSHGHEVLNPHLPDDDFDAAVRIAQAEFDQGNRMWLSPGAVAMGFKGMFPVEELRYHRTTTEISPSRTHTQP